MNLVNKIEDTNKNQKSIIKKTIHFLKRKSLPYFLTLSMATCGAFILNGCGGKSLDNYNKFNSHDISQTVLSAGGKSDSHHTTQSRYHIEVTPKKAQTTIGETLEFSAVGWDDNGTPKDKTDDIGPYPVDVKWNIKGGNIGEIFPEVGPETTLMAINFLPENKENVKGLVCATYYTPKGKKLSVRSNVTIYPVDWQENYENYDYWEAKADMPTARASFASVTVNGKIYAIGGNNVPQSGYCGLTEVEEYDPNTDTWLTKRNMPTGRQCFSAAAINGKIYAIGGYRGGYQTAVEEYDPVADTWLTKRSMPAGRAITTASAVNGKIYVIGGYNICSRSTDKVEEYDPEIDFWSTKASMPTARMGTTSSMVNGKIYVIGGHDDFNYLGTVEVYDPATDIWETGFTMMPTARYSATASVVNGKIYVIGGENSGIYNTVEEYDPETDTWRSSDINAYDFTPGEQDLTPMITARNGLESAVVDNKIYVIGGYHDPYTIGNKVEEYTPPLQK